MHTTFDILVGQEVAHAEHMKQQLDKLSTATERKDNTMKISEMTTDNFADFVAAAGDSLCNIMQNEGVAALLTPAEKRNPVRWIAEASKVLCGPCRNDLFVILAALGGKTPEEVGAQNILTTLGQLRSLYNDLKSADVPA